MPNNSLFIPSPKTEREAKAPAPLTPLRRELAREARSLGNIPRGQSTRRLSVPQLEELARKRGQFTFLALAT